MTHPGASTGHVSSMGPFRHWARKETWLLRMLGCPTATSSAGVFAKPVYAAVRACRRTTSRAGWLHMGSRWIRPPFPASKARPVT